MNLSASVCEPSPLCAQKQQTSCLFKDKKDFRKKSSFALFSIQVFLYYTFPLLDLLLFLCHTGNFIIYIFPGFPIRRGEGLLTFSYLWVVTLFRQLLCLCLLTLTSKGKVPSFSFLMKFLCPQFLPVDLQLPFTFQAESHR